jgi:hypothetical protein
MKQKDGYLDIFIWTEALGCGEILSPMLSSYLHHHDFPIHVIGYHSDFLCLPSSTKLKPMIVDLSNTKQNLSEIGTTETELKTAYKSGHLGTATLWASLIMTRKERYIIHLDADTIFLGDVVTPIIQKLKQGYGVVGTRRPYRFSESRKTFLSRAQHYFQRDAVNTHAFGFERCCIELSKEKILNSIGNSGSRVINRIFPVIDFFDRLAFYISRKRGIYYLDSKGQARSGVHTREGPFESKMISFAAVGSGYSFFHGYARSPSPSYEEFAISSYSLYARHLLGKEIGIPPMESPYLENMLGRLDRENWCLLDDSERG